ncbi:maleylpyruvate isomerase family mycothiol-dependent enzyme [Kribbella sindirgiensis]|uniref:Maleylpyruvate isomerase family mycothiol-dependent enzyme n=1 Tax=Kribbella sindirgiensis TaxID=1124744 RepID=A0A4R0J1A4_9ACTN|nr:maleylpyruvate isomerase family mycothiol-dependent enzyme [Kribbella sindirgiensis]TCC39437.1 maleylpyruvate isomerase family mycothiol-dependent enzyme [Kribbella sindirgiensis]
MTAVLAEQIGRADRVQCRSHRDAELTAWHELLASIEGDEWQRRTVCDAWDVADIAGHLIGQAEDVNKPFSFPRRYRKAKRVYPDVLRIDAHMMVQADEHRGTPPAQLRTTFDQVWAKATRKISTEPALLRRVSMTIDGFESVKLSLGYIHDILLARDLWMHRDDVSQALGRRFDAGPHATELVAQVMYDVIDGPWWGDRPTVEVELTGPGGGAYKFGRGEPVGRASVDAVTYMRTLSGRDDSPEVTGDPAAADAVASCRMPF